MTYIWSKLREVCKLSLKLWLLSGCPCLGKILYRAWTKAPLGQHRPLKRLMDKSSLENPPPLDKSPLDKSPLDKTPTGQNPLEKPPPRSKALQWQKQALYWPVQFKGLSYCTGQGKVPTYWTGQDKGPPYCTGQGKGQQYCTGQGKGPSYCTEQEKGQQYCTGQGKGPSYCTDQGKGKMHTFNIGQMFTYMEVYMKSSKSLLFLLLHSKQKLLLHYKSYQ